MPAYVINDMEVIYSGRLEEYKKLSPSTLQQFGSRFLARGGAFEVIEGEWRPKRLVVLEFPSVEQAKARADSPEYAPAKKLRQRASCSNIVLVDGTPSAAQPATVASEEHA